MINLLLKKFNPDMFLFTFFVADLKKKKSGMLLSLFQLLNSIVIFILTVDIRCFSWQIFHIAPSALPAQVSPYNEGIVQSYFCQWLKAVDPTDSPTPLILHAI